MCGPAMAHQFRVDIHALSQIDQRKKPPLRIDAPAMLKRNARRGAGAGAVHAFPDLTAWTALTLVMETVVRLAVLIIPLLFFAK